MRIELTAGLVAIVGVTAFALGGAVGWRVTSWVGQAHELAAVRTARAGDLKTIDDLKLEVKTHQDTSNAYQEELRQIRARPVDATPVRLCLPARTEKRVLPPPAPERGPPPGAPAAGLLQPGGGENLEAGPDIGPRYRALNQRADELLAQCRGLLGYASPGTPLTEPRDIF